MRTSQFSAEAIIEALKEVERGSSIADVCARYGISDATFYIWRTRYGGLSVAGLERLRTCEHMSSELRRIVASQARDIEALRGIVRILVPSVQQRREVVQRLIVTLGYSERQACGLIGMSRSTLRYDVQRGRPKGAGRR
ncbi:transposase [Burkholderia territorii]|uniref:transposase n=1 Tax=Burkholderia territorii TaxID=1503055 RepID=UPI0009C10DE7